MRSQFFLIYKKEQAYCTANTCFFPRHISQPNIRHSRKSCYECHVKSFHPTFACFSVLP